MRYWPPSTDRNELCPDPDLQAVYEAIFSAEIKHRETLHDDPPHIIAAALATIFKEYMTEIHAKGGLHETWAAEYLKEMSQACTKLVEEFTPKQAPAKGTLSH